MGTRWVAVAVPRVTPGDWRPGDTCEHTPGDTREREHAWVLPRFIPTGGRWRFTAWAPPGLAQRCPPTPPFGTAAAAGGVHGKGENSKQKIH